MNENEAEELVARAYALSQQFQQRAARYDRENEFPAEDFDDLPREGLLTAAVPVRQHIRWYSPPCRPRRKTTRCGGCC